MVEVEYANSMVLTPIPDRTLTKDIHQKEKMKKFLQDLNIMALTMPIKTLPCTVIIGTPHIQ